MGGNVGVVQPLISGDSSAGLHASSTLSEVARGSRQIYRLSEGARRFSAGVGEGAGIPLGATLARRQLSCRRIAVFPLVLGIAGRTAAAWRPAAVRGTHDLLGAVESGNRAGEPRDNRQSGPSPSVDSHNRSLSFWRQQSTRLACGLKVADRLHPQPQLSRVCDHSELSRTPQVQAAAVVRDGGGKEPGTVDIAFIGGGNMARSLLQGLIEAGHDAGRFAVSDPDAGCRDAIETLGVRATAHNQEAADRAGTVVLAVKPQVLADVLAGLSIPGETLVVSVCAGVPVDAIAGLTSQGQAIVRCMPNTAALLRAGVTALFANANTNEEERQAAEQILSAVGKTLWVDKEADLDAVTAVSGSGPAYFFYLMEAMAAAGESLGLNAEVAARLTVETAWGAARMARETGTAPSTLRRNVTSPGGTTEAAIETLDERGVNGRIVEAIGRARQRAREIADGFGPGDPPRRE